MNLVNNIPVFDLCGIESGQIWNLQFTLDRILIEVK